MPTVLVRPYHYENYPRSCICNDNSKGPKVNYALVLLKHLEDPLMCTEAPTLYQEGRQRRGSVILTHSNIQFPLCTLMFLRVASKGHYPEELKGQISLFYEGFKRGNNYVHI